MLVAERLFWGFVGFSFVAMSTPDTDNPNNPEWWLSGREGTLSRHSPLDLTNLNASKVPKQGEGGGWDPRPEAALQQEAAVGRGERRDGPEAARGGADGGRSGRSVSAVRGQPRHEGSLRREVDHPGLQDQVLSYWRSCHIFIYVPRLPGVVESGSKATPGGLRWPPQRGGHNLSVR